MQKEPRMNLVCRWPTNQTQRDALVVGMMISEGLQGLSLLGVTSLLISDASRDAVVQWLNHRDHSRLQSNQLVALMDGDRKIPLTLDNSLPFGDVYALEE